MVLETTIYDMVPKLDSSTTKTMPILEAALDNALRTGNTVKLGKWSETMMQPDFLYKAEKIPGDTNLDGWLKEKPIIEYSPKREEKYMVVAASEQPVKIDGVTKHVIPIIETELPLNLIGKYISKCENVRQAHKNYEKTLEHERLVEFLERHGYTRIANVRAYGSRKMRGLAEVIPYEDGVALIFNENLSRVIEALMDYYDFTYEEALEHLLSHEDTHLFDKRTTSKLDEERTTERLLKEFHEELAKNETDGYTSSIPESERSKKGEYKRLARANKEREENVERNYPQHTFWGRILRGSKGKENLEEIVEELVNEAKEAGCETEEEIEKYIEKRAKEYKSSPEDENYSEEKVDDGYNSEKVDNSGNDAEQAQDPEADSEASE